MKTKERKMLYIAGKYNLPLELVNLVLSEAEECLAEGLDIENWEDIRDELGIYDKDVSDRQRICFYLKVDKMFLEGTEKALLLNKEEQRKELYRLHDNIYVANPIYYYIIDRIIDTYSSIEEVEKDPDFTEFLGEETLELYAERIFSLIPGLINETTSERFERKVKEILRILNLSDEGKEIDEELIRCVLATAEQCPYNNIFEIRKKLLGLKETKYGPEEFSLVLKLDQLCLEKVKENDKKDELIKLFKLAPFGGEAQELAYQKLMSLCKTADEVYRIAKKTHFFPEAYAEEIGKNDETEEAENQEHYLVPIVDVMIVKRIYELTPNKVLFN